MKKNIKKSAKRKSKEDKPISLADSNLKNLFEELKKIRLSNIMSSEFAEGPEDLEYEDIVFNPEDDFNAYDFIYNHWDYYYLLDLFGLLNDKQELDFRRLMADHTPVPAEFIDFETIQLLDEENYKTLDNLHWQYYYQDIKVLLTYDLPCYTAYRIAEYIEDCQFIGFSIYGNDIWSIINNHLKTGECDLHW